MLEAWFDLLCAAVGHDRVYPTVLPQAPVLPAVTYQFISATRTPTMRHGDNLPAKRVQVDAWAGSALEAFQAADAIRSAFHYFVPANGIHGVFADSERSLFDPETKLHGYSRDFIVHHTES